MDENPFRVRTLPNPWHGNNEGKKINRGWDVGIPVPGISSHPLTLVWNLRLEESSANEGV
jgi:hypothetical protein